MFKKFVLTALLSINLSSYANTTDNSVFDEKEYKELITQISKVDTLEEKKKYVECIQIVDEIIATINKKIVDARIDKTDMPPQVDKLLSMLWTKHGEFNYFTSCYKEAVEDCQRALNIDEYNAQAYYFQGHAYLKMDNYKLGITCIKRAARQGYRQARDEVEAYNL